MGKSYKRGSKDSRFDDGFRNISSKDLDHKKRRDLEKKEKAKEKRFIEEIE